MGLKWMNNLVFFVMLLWAGWQDFRTRSVCLPGLVIFGCIGSLSCAAFGRSPMQIMASSAIGVILLGISRVTGQAIGEGDGWFFIVSGLYLTWWENVLLFFFGLCIAFLVSLVWIVLRRIRRKNVRVTLPFLSCLALPGIGILLFGPVLQ